MHYIKNIKIGEFLCSHFKTEDGRRYAAETHTKKIGVVYAEGAVTDQTCQSGLRSFLVLLTFWPNNSLLWGWSYALEDV